MLKIPVCNSGIVNKLTPKYIIVSDSGKLNNLGHELFFTRKILFTLLYYKLIKTDICCYF